MDTLKDPWPSFCRGDPDQAGRRRSAQHQGLLGLDPRHRSPGEVDRPFGPLQAHVDRHALAADQSSWIGHHEPRRQPHAPGPHLKFDEKSQLQSTKNDHVHAAYRRSRADSESVIVVVLEINFHSNNLPHFKNEVVNKSGKLSSLMGLV